jgi:hypothetical protein
MMYKPKPRWHRPQIRWADRSVEFWGVRITCALYPALPYYC